MPIKRGNRQLFFDHETGRVLQAWLSSQPDIVTNYRGFISTRRQGISPREIEVLTQERASLRRMI